jgi:DNA-binding transcriptional regulator/RsmH inhibitor MraZ
MEFRRPLDDKGRIVLPADLRERWKTGELIIRPDGEVALIYPPRINRERLLNSLETILLEEKLRQRAIVEFKHKKKGGG